MKSSGIGEVVNFARIIAGISINKTSIQAGYIRKFSVCPGLLAVRINIARLILENIGNKYGAIDDFFDRTKNKAQALPPRPKRKIPEIEELGIHFPLRIYCYRISESIVVLVNGGLKDARTDQLSNDISLKFYEAQQFAERIENGLRDGMIIISEDNRYLTDFNNSNEIIL